jgi:hypothetical protein
MFRYLTFSLVALGLYGCGHTPLTRTLFDAAGWTTSVDTAKLNPNYQYLRVSTPERAILMVLGYVDDTPEGKIETWYSKAGQVIRLKDGRLHSTQGFPVDWTMVAYRYLPSWSSATAWGHSRFTRYRDEMPGYKVGVFDEIALRTINPPHDSRLSGIPPDKLTWVEETTYALPRNTPSARYGLTFANGLGVVVYGEQCLNSGFCLAWQTWPAKS